MPDDAILIGGGKKNDTAVYLSVDGGKQWAKVSGERGETGEQGPTGSQGPAGSGGGGGSSFFSDVKVYDDYVEFILTDGTRFSMPVTVENYIDINDIDWDKSNVWKVMDGDKQVAEICKEGFGRIPGQNGVTYQVVAVYPVGEDNKVDLANGYIAKYLGGAKGCRNIAGGNIGWTMRGSYENGNVSPLAAFIAGTGGKEEISKLMITSSKNVKECKNGIDKYKLEPYTISDADGIEYPIVKIGASYWMRENLRATKFKDGTSLVYQRSATDDQKSQTVYLNEYSTGTQYQKAAMYDYYKKDDSFDVESQSDEVKKRYGLHYNFSAVAGDYDPYVQNLGSDYNILSQDIEGQTNNSLCPEGWHIPTSFTHGVFGNYYADMEYIDYIFGFDWWHMMASNVAENKDSRDWVAAQWWKSGDNTPDNLSGLSLYAVPALGQTTGFGKTNTPKFNSTELEGTVLFWVDILSKGIPMLPYLDGDNDMINNNVSAAAVGACYFPIRCVRD